ncbi:hypothetical protein EJB05_43795 [Eragrostis curvula]|uniref:Myb/SANT-like domain-containing protein n=1 Tax=Eragrostis curvula TaxID=38414 RepID=A0A5J9TG99_9POAL|nr:hypothetical protein EJB05_43795 [Eragrostis curvula]
MATQDVEKGKKVPRGYVPWDDEMDKVLLDTFVEYYKKGDMCQNGWKSHVYTAAIKNVREKCGVNIAKSNIESRSKTFDKHYNIINGMLSSSGFGWDWERNKLSIDSESVWESYVEGEVDSSLERRGRREG